MFYRPALNGIHTSITTWKARCRFRLTDSSVSCVGVWQWRGSDPVQFTDSVSCWLQPTERGASLGRTRYPSVVQKGHGFWVGTCSWTWAHGVGCGLTENRSGSQLRYSSVRMIAWRYMCLSGSHHFCCFYLHFSYLLLNDRGHHL